MTRRPREVGPIAGHRWVCGRCRVSHLVGEAAAKTVLRCPEKGCGLPYWVGSNLNHAFVGITPSTYAARSDASADMARMFAAGDVAP